MVVLLMGVSGSGKTTIGTLLAHDLGWEFFDADDFHPAANVAKMRRGEPLSDADRDGWLDSLCALIDQLLREHRPAVLACSALRGTYRDRLRAGRTEVAVVYLHGDEALIRARMEKRQGHFMTSALLASQFATLEEPHDAQYVVDIDATPATIVERIRTGLGLTP